MRKLLCALGIHNWYVDSAMFACVGRCNYCSAVDSKLDAWAVDRERKFWDEQQHSEG